MLHSPDFDPHKKHKSDKTRKVKSRISTSCVTNRFTNSIRFEKQALNESPLTKSGARMLVKEYDRKQKEIEDQFNYENSMQLKVKY